MKTLQIKILILLILISGSSISAQKFKVTVDKSTVGINQTFQIDFTFNGGDLNSLTEFMPPAFTGLSILSGPNESRSMQIINGQVSGSLTYSFIVRPTKLGKITIGKASVKYKGKVLTTNPISINVVKMATAPNKKTANKGISKEEIAKNVFILAVPNKRTVLQGEQITVTYKLYTRLNISSPQISKLPEYKGFWAEELESPTTIRFNYEMYKGRRFRSAVIKKVALFPSKTGKLSITPFELNIPVLVRRKRSRDLFDDFFSDSFFGRTETIDFLAKSNRININVKPLPEEGKPASFKGAIGEFKISAKIDKQKVKVNEPISVKIKISGSGNIALLEIPDLKLPPGFEKYEPKTTQKIYRKNVISGTKTIEYLIVPRIAGEKTIPPIEFTYFSLKQNKYVTEKTSPFNITVEKGEGEYTQTAAGYTKEDIKLLSKDIRFIKTDFKLQKRSTIRLINNWFWFALVFPLLVLITLIGYQKRKDKLSGNIGLLKFQKAEKNAKNKLKQAQKFLENGDKESYYNGLSQALFGYLEDKLNIKKAEFTKERAVAKLRELNVNEDLIKKVEQLSDKCEFARFAPNAQSSQSETELFEETNNLIQQLQSSISNKKIKKL